MEVLKKYTQLRFCRIKKGTKIPLEKEWTKKPYTYSELQTYKNENYGILCGYGGLIVIDSDTPELQIEIEKHLPKTFKVRTGGGGTHNYYFCEECKNKIVLTTMIFGKEKHWGEVQSWGTQVVGPGSIHPSGIPYTVLNDTTIEEITYTDLIEAIKPFMKEMQQPEINYKEEKKGFEKEDIDNLNIVDIWGTIGLEKKHSEYYGPHPVHGSEGGTNFWINSSKNVWHCFRCDSGGGPLSAIAVKEGLINCSDAQKGYLRGDKALKAIDIAKEKYGLNKFNLEPVREILQVGKRLELWTYKDYENLEKDTSFIIQDFIYPKTVAMIYSPPGQFKSILALNLAMCVATGKKWLGFETKTNPVLYCDKENNDQIIKERLANLFKGNNLDKKDFPLYILRRNGDLLDEEFLSLLKEQIKEKEIKIIFFDTLHRFADYDENSSNDINRLYTKVFQPFIEEYGLSVIFLHHTTKSGGYRGSGDFLALVDTSYAIYRDGKTDRFSIFNEKCRSGEIDKILGEIDFGDDYIKIIRLNEEVEEDKKLSKLKEITNKIKSQFKEGDMFKRKDILDAFEIEEYECSPKTVSRSLKWLTTNGYLDKNEKGEYSIILR